MNSGYSFPSISSVADLFSATALLEPEGVGVASHLGQGRRHVWGTHGVGTSGGPRAPSN